MPKPAGSSSSLRSISARISARTAASSGVSRGDIAIVSSSISDGAATIGTTLSRRAVRRSRPRHSLSATNTRAQALKHSSSQRRPGEGKAGHEDCSRPQLCENSKTSRFRVSVWYSRRVDRRIQSDLKGRLRSRTLRRCVFTQPRPSADFCCPATRIGQRLFLGQPQFHATCLAVHQFAARGSRAPSKLPSSGRLLSLTGGRDCFSTESTSAQKQS